MLQLKNQTAFEATLLLVPDPQGVESVYAIVKGTFLLDQRLSVAPEQVPLVEADQHHGDPGLTSHKAASDMGLIKPGTDVLLNATAHAPDGKPVCESEVSLRLGSVDKTVRVFGDRVWRESILGAGISDPEPFEKMPLVWERAFGGTDETKHEPPKVADEDRNPVGTGFCIGNGKNQIDGMMLPNLEDPQKLISKWKDRPAPAGFGLICPHWEPRRSYAGTYDEDWQKHRAPYLPKDFDPRFFHLAPPDQVVTEYLTGGEDVEVTGVGPYGPLRFRLPTVPVQVAYRLDNEKHAPPVNLDTVLIEPDASRLVLLWRTVLPCDKKTLLVREVEISSQEDG